MSALQETILFIRRSPLEVSAALLVAIAVILAGWAVVATVAAGPFAHADASSATITGGAKLVTDATAVNGKALQFATETTSPPPVVSKDLSDPTKKDMAMRLVSSAENSSLDWKAQYKYIEDIGDGRGYTGGIIGFTSGTHDMLELVQYYTKIAPGNVLAKYVPALQKVDGTDSHEGLGTAFVNDWVKAAADAKFQQAQNDERDRTYFNPAVTQGKADGLRALGQFIYYDALVMHGPGSDSVSYGGIRAAAIKKAKTPAQGGDEKAYLNAFLDARKAAMLTEEAHSETDRVDTMQRPFLTSNNYDLNAPLSWSMYGEAFSIK